MKLSKKNQLKKIRDSIDKIDQKILKLLNERAQEAIKTTKYKTDRIYDPKREKEVLGKLLRNAKGPLSNLAVEQVYGEILSACREVQAPIRVSFLGPEGSNTEEVAKKQFGNSASFFPQQTIFDVFNSVESGDSIYGVVPLENSLEGPVVETLDALVEKNVSIVSQVKLKISHYLMSQEKYREGQRVYDVYNRKIPTFSLHVRGHFSSRYPTAHLS